MSKHAQDLTKVYVMLHLLFLFLTCFDLTKNFGKKIQLAKNKDADENLHFQKHTIFLVKL